jgi:hypothetical protein
MPVVATAGVFFFRTRLGVPMRVFHFYFSSALKIKGIGMGLEIGLF